MVDVRFIDQARRDLALLLASHPELEEDEVLRADMIDGSTDAMELLDELIQAVQEANALQAAVRTHISFLTKRLERFCDREDSLRKYIMQLMEATNLKKIERPAATVSIAAGRPKVVITDESKLASAFKRVKEEPNKELIAQWLKDGHQVDGATLSNTAPVLRIS